MKIDLQSARRVHRFKSYLVLYGILLNSVTNKLKLRFCAPPVAVYVTILPLQSSEDSYTTTSVDLFFILPELLEDVSGCISKVCNF